jgi:Fur family ferric uptake transcriptional regulator
MAGSLSEQFATFLRSKGLQPTAKRLRIAAQIEARGGHPSLPELSRDLADLGEITVYRALKLLEEAGLVERLMLDGVARYERVGAHHDHFVCVDCGWVVEFHSEPLEALQREVAATNGFVVRGHEHVIEVRCGRPSCASTRSPSPSVKHR